MAQWPGSVFAVTLFVEDLTAAKEFYAAVFGLPVVHEDPQSAVFRFGGLLVNLLQVDAAPELVEPALVAPVDAGQRFVLTLQVDDVDATVARLREHGVELLNGPLDRPWGPRTASFRDPGGHVWEIASS